MRFTEPVMRPPQEARSLLPRATQGCTYNKCHFCYVSRGYNFLAVTPEELEQEIGPLKKYYPPDTKIYLTGSNPLALPVDLLKQYIEVLRKHFPQFAELSMQARIDDIAGKHDSELAELCALGLKHLYIGVENGNDKALDAMNKGYHAEDVVCQLKRLDQAGIEYTNFYLLGMGGKGAGIESALATAKMFNQVRPRRITTTGLTIFEDTPLAEMVRNGQFIQPSEKEKIEELKTFLENLEIDTFYDGIHYLNPVNYRLRTGDIAAKANVIADLEAILGEYTEEELERMVNRAQMKSL